MGTLGLNKLIKCLKTGSLTEKINWSIDERQGIQRLVHIDILSKLSPYNPFRLFLGSG